jgi:hypothetical protein
MLEQRNERKIMVIFVGALMTLSNILFGMNIYGFFQVKSTITNILWALANGTLITLFYLLSAHDGIMSNREKKVEV